MTSAIAAATAAGVIALSGAAYAACHSGETTIRFSHVVSATGHPKDEAATLFGVLILITCVPEVSPFLPNLLD